MFSAVFSAPDLSQSGKLFSLSLSLDVEISVSEIFSASEFPPLSQSGRGLSLVFFCDVYEKFSLISRGLFAGFSAIFSSTISSVFSGFSAISVFSVGAASQSGNPPSVFGVDVSERISSGFSALASVAGLSQSGNPPASVFSIGALFSEIFSGIFVFSAGLSQSGTPPSVFSEIFSSTASLAPRGSSIAISLGGVYDLSGSTSSTLVSSKIVSTDGFGVTIAIGVVSSDFLPLN